MDLGQRSLLVLLVVTSCLLQSEGAALESNETRRIVLVAPEEPLKALFNLPEPQTSHIQLLVDKFLGNFSVSVASSKLSVVSVVQETVVMMKCSKQVMDPSEQTLALQMQSNNSSQTPYSHYTYEPEATEQTDKQLCFNVSFKVRGNYVGYATLTVTAHTTDRLREEVGSAPVICYRHYRTIDYLFRKVVFIFVAVALFGMGNEIDWSVIRAHLRKPKAPVIALFSQYTFMPSLAFAVIYLGGYQGGWALGLFTYGCSPGGGASNIYSKLFNGDMSLSVTMTTLSTIASIGMLPLYIYTLGRLLPVDEDVGDIEIPFVNLIVSLAAIIVPLAIGALVQWKLSRASLIIKKCLKVFLLFVVIFMLTIGVYSNLYIYQSFDAKLVGSVAILPVGGFTFGGVLALVCRMEWKLVKTIALETGIQNPAIPALVVQSALASPESDLAIIPVLAAAMVSSMPCLLFSIIYSIYRFYQKKKRQRKGNSLADSDKTNDPDVEKELMEMDSTKFQLTNASTERQCASVDEKGELLEEDTSKSIEKQETTKP